MKFSREQIRSAYQNLPSGTQNFVHSNENSDLIKLLLMGVGLSEEQTDGPGDSAVLHAMYGLHSLHEAIADIAQLIGKAPEELAQLESVLDEQIFSKLKR